MFLQREIGGLWFFSMYGPGISSSDFYYTDYENLDLDIDMK